VKTNTTDFFRSACTTLQVRESRLSGSPAGVLLAEFKRARLSPGASFLRINFDVRRSDCRKQAIRPTAKYVLQKPIYVFRNWRAAGFNLKALKTGAVLQFQKPKDFPMQTDLARPLVADFVPAVWTAATSGVHSGDGLHLP